MNRYKLILGIIVTALVINLSLDYGNIIPKLSAQIPAKSHELTIEKTNNKWKVVHSGNRTQTKVNAKRGEKIIWRATTSDLYFQFMDTNLFGYYTRKLKKGQKLTLVIGNKAKKGANRYAVFCADGLEFAEGDSPPEIIVE